MTPEERRSALEAVAAEVRGCTRCRLHVQRTQAVPGEGDPETEVVFVGEGPGFNEDRQGRPFVGAAGQLLNELLGAIGWRREEVFITNVVKCRPPENRDPQPDEIAACAPYLRRQLEVLDPAVVVTLGRHSLQTFMPGTRIGGAHGTQRPADPAGGAQGAAAYAMYHPAAALRQGSLRQTMLEDMCGLPDVLIAARQRRAPGQPATAPDPEEAVAPHQPATAPDQPATAVHEIPLTPEPQPVAIAVAAGADPENQMELF
ncbi:MAG TPA: uracil-DNA glycosylase [Candidatus Limnocylindria bacterium]|nr:uracil-DNA glycosylase [Candidatus Limnocylindria bacterium]